MLASQKVGTVKGGWGGMGSGEAAGTNLEVSKFDRRMTYLQGRDWAVACPPSWWCEDFVTGRDRNRVGVSVMS